MKFVPVYFPTRDDEKLSVHDAPPGLWRRVAVISAWQDAAIARRRWPHAACVGPLRTRRGIDILVRSLLNNPQIRCLIVDGPTAGVVGEETLSALRALWRGESHRDLLGDDIGHPEAAALVRDVALLDMKDGWRRLGELDNEPRAYGRPEWDIREFIRPVDSPRYGNVVVDILSYATHPIPDEDRPGGAIFLSPPPPKIEAAAPHGDPGERVAGDTLAEVWPLALHRIMRFGRDVSGTREFWNLVSVIRDARGSITGLLGGPVGQEHSDPAWVHPSLGVSFEQAQWYYRESLTGAVPPEGATYSYGSRMRGAGIQSNVSVTSRRKDGDLVLYADEICSAGTCTLPPGHKGHHTQFGDEHPDMVKPHPDWKRDQIAAVQHLLASKPDARGAFLTPWRAQDASAKDPPCLVGVQFRMAPDDYVGDGSPINPDERRLLHMTVWFRSHDMTSGYPLNLAGCCLWLVEEATRLGVAVGTLTCLSGSAHIYDRDRERAEQVIAKIKWPAIRWDQRSSWKIEKVDGPEDVEEACGEIQNSEDHDTICGRKATFAYDVGLKELFFMCDEHGFSQFKKPLPKKPLLRATAFSPGPESDGKVIAVLEAPTPGALKLAIERSGLVTEIGAALYLGQEIERVWRGN